MNKWNKFQYHYKVYFESISVVWCTLYCRAQAKRINSHFATIFDRNDRMIEMLGEI